MAKTKSNKGKAKVVATEGPSEEAEEEIVLLEHAPGRGQDVPAMIKDPPLESVMKAKDLVTQWEWHGSQAVWKMTCLIEMEKYKSDMWPLSKDNTVYMGQVVPRCAASLRLRALFLVEWCGHLRRGWML